MDKFNQLVAHCASEGVSDLHITGGHPTVMRKNGALLFDRASTWRHDEVDALARNLLNPLQVQQLRQRMSVDLARSVQNVRLRINLFSSLRGLSLAIRLLPGRAPDLAGLNLHPCLQQYGKLAAGLILICGSTGSGKSSTMAALIEEVNRSRAVHIVTLEDPVEYRFQSRKAFIEQRELGTHFPSFEQGLRDVLRENPDVILVGELREPETIRLTLGAAESGHLVIGSLHGSSPEEALHRICLSFAPESQELVRHQLAASLALLVVQKLVLIKRAGFRVPVLSILCGTQPVRSIIRDNRLAQIESTLQTGRSQGMFTMPRYREEFIDTLERFSPPAAVFSPSTEPSSEIIHRSVLLEPPMPGQCASDPRDEEVSATEIRRSLGRRHYDAGPHLVIDEEASMDEVLAEMQRKAGDAPVGGGGAAA